MNLWFSIWKSFLDRASSIRPVNSLGVYIFFKTLLKHAQKLVIRLNLQLEVASIILAQILILFKNISLESLSLFCFELDLAWKCLAQIWLKPSQSFQRFEFEVSCFIEIEVKCSYRYKPEPKHFGKLKAWKIRNFH